MIKKEILNKKIGYIYIATNKINGKKYVGQTRQKVKRRMKQHLYVKHNLPFVNAYQKHPEYFDIWFTDFEKENLTFWEEFYIKKFNTRWPNGYNLTNGGGGCEMSDEIKKKMRNDKKGNKNPNFGNYWTDKQKKAQSEKMKGRYVKEKNPHAREVILISPPPENKPYCLFYYKDFCLEHKLCPSAIYVPFYKRKINIIGWTGYYKEVKTRV